MANSIGISTITNVIFSVNGSGHSRHDNEDVTFNFEFTDALTGSPGLVLCILDGHEGDFVARFVRDRLRTEFSKTNWSYNICTEDAIKKFFFEILDKIDKQLLQSIDALAPEYQSSEQPQDDAASMRMISEMEQREKKQTCGCSAVIALILRNKLYMANVGDCHAMLCIQDPQSNAAGSIPLTEEHTLRNEHELTRLRQNCGLLPHALRQMLNHGKYDHTRCLGNYRIKKEYRTFTYLAEARSAPIVSTPQITLGQKIHANATWCYLVLMSSGLCRLLHEICIDREKVDGEVEHMIRTAVAEAQGKQVTSLTQIADMVVKSLSRKCFEGFLNSRDAGVESVECNGFTGHDDLTLLLYRFQSPDPDLPQETVVQTEATLAPVPGPDSFQILTDEGPLGNSETQSNSNHSQSGEDSQPFPYVDLRQFDIALERMSPTKLATLNSILDSWPQSLPDTIPEEETENHTEEQPTEERENTASSYEVVTPALNKEVDHPDHRSQPIPPVIDDIGLMSLPSLPASFVNK